MSPKNFVSDLSVGKTVTKKKILEANKSIDFLREVETLIQKRFPKSIFSYSPELKITIR